ncbi:MAG: hypothetical protein Q9181_003085 [Wetmoreana brouardii]
MGGLACCFSGPGLVHGLTNTTVMHIGSSESVWYKASRIVTVDLTVGHTNSGGTVISTILTSRNDVLEHCNLSLLVRGADKARVFNEKGLKTVLFENLKDTQEIERIASGFDLVINITPGGSVGSAIAFIKGLNNRREFTGRDVSYIHTSGTSNVADQPITGAYHEARTFTDTSPDLYTYLKHRESLAPYPQRTTDIAVIEAGRACSVYTYIIMPPSIYGPGTGDFNRLTIQVPTVMRSALEKGYVMQLGRDDGDVEHVHVEDLADLYILVADRVLKGELKGMPSGERGIYFAGTGRHTWKEFSRGIVDALIELGGIKDKEIRKVGVKEAADSWTGGNELLCELNFGSNFRTNAETSRSLGWQPKKTKDDFNNHYLETAKMVMQT